MQGLRSAISVRGLPHLGAALGKRRLFTLWSVVSLPPVDRTGMLAAPRFRASMNVPSKSPANKPQKRPQRKSLAAGVVALRGVRQNNLQGIDLDLPLGKLVAITGVSGSGKSSLAFDTLYAEGQRRYVECLSSYARQFMQRMPRPEADSIQGIVPTVALQQGKRMRASRATVATLTDVLDYLKIVFAAQALPTCPSCGREMARLHPAQVADEVAVAGDGRKALVTFPLRVPGLSAVNAVRNGLLVAGYSRLWRDGRVVQVADLPDAEWLDGELAVLQDRLKLAATDTARLHDSVDQAMRRGDGIADLWVDGATLEGIKLLDVQREEGGLRRYRATASLRCLSCDSELPDPSPSLFSYNSPLGACEHCNGFGRIMKIDWDRCIPDPNLTLRGSKNSLKNKAIRPWATKKTGWERKQLYTFCEAVGIPDDVPWRKLSDEHKRWIIDGYPDDDAPAFYSLRAWFDWLQARSYRMHVRVQLARYRTYKPCPQCKGARLKPESLAWKLDGWALPQWLAAPIEDVVEKLGRLAVMPATGKALDQPLEELRRRVGLLHELGLSYLALDRAGRTLSGGELQRVQLVTALASGLSQVLYVLDEPSVGLHPRDTERLLGILRRLVTAGNSVVVVEHDPALILAADYLVDLGPGAGEHGGQIVYAGPPDAIGEDVAGPTADYLLGRTTPPASPLPTEESPADTRAVAIAQRARTIARKRGFAGVSSNPWLVLRGVSARNLDIRSVRFKRGALNAVCGVSGSGKSTLIDEVLYRHMLRRLGRATEPPGACRELIGLDGVQDVVLVQQAPIAGSTRANCATYLKAWDAIRRRLAAEDLAKDRGYTASTFSFNTKGGRCDVCEGAGVEIVDMQFLSDVRIACEACGGQRFSREVLQVKHRGRTVADFLAMTASEVVANFTDDRRLCRPFAAMVELGLGYLRLGQSLATLSGGESQRLKIAHHLLCARTRGALMLLDEPSTGLHVADVRVLIECMRRLVDAGNTVIVIEHNLDVIAAAEHVIELGPEGGPGGGKIVFTGTADRLVKRGDTITADYMRKHRDEPTKAAQPRDGDGGEHATTAAQRVIGDSGQIQVRGARVHNLRNLDIDVPRDRLTVVTGLSGSGKSSLAFDVLFAEGQRRFLDCLSPYARQYLPPIARPDVDSLRGLPPTVAIAQRTTRGGMRSTVATLTDIYPYLRLLFARCGTQRCPTCGEPVSAQKTSDIAASIRRRFRGAPLYVMTPLIRGRKGHHRDVIEKCRDAGRRFVHIDGRLLPTRAVPQLRRYVAHDIDEVIARLPWTAESTTRNQWKVRPLINAVEAAIAAGDGTVVCRQADGEAVVFARDRHCGSCDISVEPPDPLLFSFTSKRGWCPHCTGSGVEPVPVEPKKKKKRRRRRNRATKSTAEQAGADFEKQAREGENHTLRIVQACSACGGSRVRAEARAVTIGQRTIDGLVAMTPKALSDALGGLKWRRREAIVAEGIVREVRTRCELLEQIGLSYLALGRGAVTLSGGESQRIRLAAQLASNLRGVLYVLDEPSIGLHPADNQRLLAAFQALRKRGSGLLVVEHDEATIRQADHVIELGPGGGEHGGTVIHEGPLAALLKRDDSPTAKVLRDASTRRSRTEPRDLAGAEPIAIRGAHRNNLHGADASFMRGRFNVVSGVSGSGKSTLVRDLLVREGRGWLGDEDHRFAEVVTLDGLEGIGRIAEVDQSPIGRTPRSCPATYLKVFDPIRRFFASLPDAKVLGLTPSGFSFNVPGGRCESCKGAGKRKLEMSFLPAGYVNCEGCSGARYDARTLQVRHNGASVADVLGMAIQDAADHFASVSAVARPLRMACKMGLGYLRLGQGSNTLSGGEAQRIKLVAELARRRHSETLYVLDEPTTGLHLADQRRLMDVLHDLVDRGDTLIVIEHNIDLLLEADWLVDLGPGGGDAGGEVLWQGGVVPYIDADTDTPTARALRSGHRA